MAINKEWLSNVKESVKYSGEKVVSKQMPTLANLKSAINVGEIKNLITGASKVDSKGMIATNAKKIGSNVSTIVSNAKEDLKSGNLYNMEREMGSMMDAMFSMMGLDDLDDQIDAAVGDDPGHHAVSEAGSKSEMADLAVNITNTQVNTTEALIGANASSSKMIAETNIAVGNATVQALMASHAHSMRALENIQTVNTQLLEFHNTTVVEQYNKTNQFYDDVSTKLDKISTILQQGMGTEGPKSVHDVRDAKTRAGVDKIYTSEGIDFEAYMGSVKGGIKGLFDEGSSMGIPSMNEITAMLKMAQGSPVSMAMEYAASGLLGKKNRDKLTQLDNAVGGVFATMILTMEDWKKQAKKPGASFMDTSKGFVADILGLSGLDTAGDDKLLGSYRDRELNKSRKMEQHKALTEVIPALLAKLVEGQTGQYMVYDYSRGTFTSGQTAKRGMDAVYDGVVQSGPKSYEQSRRLIASKTGLSISEVDKFLNAVTSTDGVYDPTKTNLDELDKKTFTNIDRAVAERVNEAMKDMTHFERLGFNTEHLKAKQRKIKDRQKFSTILHDTGLSSVYNNMMDLEIKNNKLSSGPLKPVDNRRFGEFSLQTFAETMKESVSTAVADAVKPIAREKQLPVRKATNEVHAKILRDKHSVGSKVPTKSISQIISEEETEHLNKMKMGQIEQQESDGRDIISKIKQWFEKPIKLLTDAFSNIDKSIYKLIYGSDDPDAGKKGLSHVVVEKITAIFSKVKGVMTEKIIDPLKNKLFGGDGEDGFFSKTTMDKVKKALPDATVGALGGMAASMVLPGGPILGALVGSSIAFASHSDRAKNYLFGEMQDDGTRKDDGLIPKEYQEIFGKYAKPAGAGAGVGLVGSIFLPGGPVFGALLGATAGIITQTDKFKDFMWGEEVDGVRKGGLYGNVTDFFKTNLLNPFKDWLGKSKDNVREWWSKTIADPFRAGIEPMKEAFGVIGETIKSTFADMGNAIKETISSIFETQVGQPLGEFVKEKIINPITGVMNKVVSKIASGLGWLVSLPVRAMHGITKEILGEERYNEVRARAEEKRKAKEEAKKAKSGKSEDKESTKVGKKTVKGRKDRKKRATGENVPDPITGKYGPRIDAIPETPIADATSYTTSTVGSPKVGKFNLQMFADTPSVSVMDAPTQQAIPQHETAKKALGMSQQAQSTNIDYTFPEEERQLAKKEQKEKKKEDKQTFKAIKNTSKHTELIYKEIHDQLNGVGWNLEYIKNIMVDQFGEPSKLPGGEAKGGNKRYASFLTQLMDIVKSPIDWVKDKIDGVKEWFSGVGEWFRNSPLGKVLNALAHPIDNIIKPMGKFIWGGLTKFGKYVQKNFFPALKAIGKGLAWTVKSIGKGVLWTGKKVAQGLAFAGKKVGKGLLWTGKTLGKGLVKSLEYGGKALAWSIGKTFKAGAWLIGTAAKGVVWSIGKAAKAVGYVGKKVWGAVKLAGKAITAPFRWIKSLFKPDEPKQFQITGGIIDKVKEVEVVRIVETVGAKSSQVASEAVHGTTPVPQSPQDFIKSQAEKERAQRANSVKQDRWNDTWEEIANMPDSTTSVVPQSTIPVNHKPARDFMKEQAEKERATRQSQDEALAQTRGRFIDPSVRETAISIRKSPSEIGNGKDKHIKRTRNRLFKIQNQDDVSNAQLELSYATSVASMETAEAIRGGGKGDKGLVGSILDLATNFGKYKIAALSMLGGIKAGLVGFSLMEKLRGDDSVTGGTEGLVKTLVRHTPLKKPANKAIRNAAKSAGEKGLKAITKNAASSNSFVQRISKGILNLINGRAAKRAMGRVGSEMASKGGTTIVKKITNWLTRNASRSLGKIAASFTPVGILFAVYDITSGMSEVRHIFRLPPDYRPTIGMRIASGLAKAISGRCYGLIPLQWLAEQIYGVFASDDRNAELREEQERHREEYEAYVAANPEDADMTFGEYNAQNNRTWMRRLWDNTGGRITRPSQARLERNRRAQANLGYGRGPVQAIGSQGNAKRDSSPEMVKGFPYYSQNDNRWKDEPFGIFNGRQDTIGEGGCAPTVASMLVSKLKKKNITPLMAAEYAQEAGFKRDNDGTSPDFFPAFASYFDIGMKHISPAASTEITSNLHRNNPLVLMGQNHSGSENSPFGQMPHYVIAHGIDKDGNINIYDPSSNKKMSRFNFVDVLEDTTVVMGPHDRRLTDSQYESLIRNQSSGGGRGDGERPNIFQRMFDDIHLVRTGQYGMNNTGGLSTSSTPATDIGLSLNPFGTWDSGRAAVKNGPVFTGNEWVVGTQPDRLNIHAWFAYRLSKMAEHHKRKMVILSGYRSTATQQRLWDDHKRKNPTMPDSQRVFAVARPGSSIHELGLAVDIHTQYYKDLPNSEFEKFGLHKPLVKHGEPWHVEPIETKGKRFAQVRDLYGVPNFDFTDNTFMTVSARESAKVMKSGNLPDTSHVKLRINNQSNYNFIREIDAAAVKVGHEYGIHPSITLAQAALETGWGNSRIGNNIFGIKATPNWTGKVQRQVATTEDRGNGLQREYHDFRDYDTVYDSIRDHAKLLGTAPIYQKYRDTPDYRAGAKALQGTYATDRDYANKLINIIEGSGFYQYDSIAKKPQSSVSSPNVFNTSNPNPTGRPLLPGMPPTRLHGEFGFGRGDKSKHPKITPPSFKLGRGPLDEQPERQMVEPKIKPPVNTINSTYETVTDPDKARLIANRQPADLNSDIRKLVEVAKGKSDEVTTALVTIAGRMLESLERLEHKLDQSNQLQLEKLKMQAETIKATLAGRIEAINMMNRIPTTSSSSGNNYSLSDKTHISKANLAKGIVSK